MAFIRTMTRLVRRHVVVVVMLLLLIVGQIITNGILLTAFNLTGMLIMIAALGLLVLGETIVIVTGGIDLSVGAIASLTTVLCAALMNALAKSYQPATVILLVILAVLAEGAVLGVLAGWTVARFSVPPFVATLCTMSIAYGFAWYTLGGRPTAISIASFRGLAWGTVLHVPVPLMIIVVATVVAHLGMRYTKYGTYLFAVGGNEYAARLSGVKTVGVRVIAYGLSGCLAAASGVLIASMTASGTVNAARGYEFLAITGAVLGGTSLFGGEGSVGHAIVAAIILSALKKVLSLLGVSPYVQEAVIGVLLISIAYIDVRSRE